MRLPAERDDGAPRADGHEVAYAANHDLRAPLVAICQLVESIQEDFAAELPAEVARRLVLVRERAEGLDALLKRLTRFWRAGDTTERAGPIDLARLVADCAGDLEPPAGAVVETDAGAPVIEAPRRALRQVLCELIDNALRHAGRPDVRVRVSATRRGGGWEIAVSDDGEGIPARYRDRVWRLFTTLRAHGHSGGLGLAIARRIVEAHGGQVWIEDAPGAGARVAFFWPAPA